MSNSTINILLISFLAIELLLFHGFYSRRNGNRATYTSWYAWVIDLLALFSGISILSFTLLTLYFPSIYQLEVPNILLYSLFIASSFQFSLHLVRLVVRNTKIYLERRRLEIQLDLEKYKDLDLFEDVYNREVEEYAKKMNKQV